MSNKTSTDCLLGIVRREGKTYIKLQIQKDAKTDNHYLSLSDFADLSFTIKSIEYRLLCAGVHDIHYQKPIRNEGSYLDHYVVPWTRSEIERKEVEIKKKRLPINLIAEKGGIPTLKSTPRKDDCDLTTFFSNFNPDESSEKTAKEVDYNENIIIDENSTSEKTAKEVDSNENIIIGENSTNTGDNSSEKKRKYPFNDEEEENNKLNPEIINESTSEHLFSANSNSNKTKALLRKQARDFLACIYSQLFIKSWTTELKKICSGCRMESTVWNEHNICSKATTREQVEMIINTVDIDEKTVKQIFCAKFGKDRYLAKTTLMKTKTFLNDLKNQLFKDIVEIFK